MFRYWPSEGFSRMFLKAAVLNCRFLLFKSIEFGRYSLARAEWTLCLRSGFEATLSRCRGPRLSTVSLELIECRFPGANLNSFPLPVENQNDQKCSKLKTFVVFYKITIWPRGGLDVEGLERFLDCFQSPRTGPPGVHVPPRVFFPIRGHPVYLPSLTVS